MNEPHLQLSMGDMRLLARPLVDAGSFSSLQSALPASGRAVQDAWSGEVLRLRGLHVDRSLLSRSPLWLMYPGLIGADERTAELVICYGQGSLRDGSGPIGVVPLAEACGDMGPFTEWGSYADSRGAVPAELSATNAVPDQPGGVGVEIHVSLGAARARAELLMDSSPLTCNALMRRLPLRGTGTNTIFSGPLVRFWNPDGAANGETPLEERLGQYQEGFIARPSVRTRAGRGITVAGEPLHTILYPGYLYYTPRPPWRGIRIATAQPARMGGGLVPFARFTGDWTGFRDVAEKLLETGAVEMAFEAVGA